VRTYSHITEAEVAARQSLWEIEQVQRAADSQRQAVANIRQKIEDQEFVIAGLGRISEIAGSFPKDVGGSIAALGAGGSYSSAVGCVRTHVIALSAASAREANLQIERLAKRLSVAEKQLADTEAALARSSSRP